MMKVQKLRFSLVFRILLIDNHLPESILLFYGEYDYSYNGYDINKVLYKTAENEYALDTPEQLSFLAEVVNGGYNDFNGVTIRITEDIDLAGWDWTPIGTSVHPFRGTIDGALPTKSGSACSVVSGLDVRQYKGAAGLFGVLNGTVKNLVLRDVDVRGKAGVGTVAGKIFTDGLIENVHISEAEVVGSEYVGGIAGYVYGSVNDCYVSASEITAVPSLYGIVYENGDKVGGIVGLFCKDNSDDESIKGNLVENVEVKGYCDLGGIAGAARADLVKANTVRDSKIIVDQKANCYGDKDANAGEIVGRTLAGELGCGNVYEFVEIIGGNK